MSYKYKLESSAVLYLYQMERLVGTPLVMLMGETTALITWGGRDTKESVWSEL